MPDKTPARPELPEPLLADIWFKAAPVTFIRVSDCKKYGRDVEAWARADERRKALEEAAKQVIATRGQYHAADDILALIDKEPTA